RIGQVVLEYRRARAHRRGGRGGLRLRFPVTSGRGGLRGKRERGHGISTRHHHGFLPAGFGSSLSFFSSIALPAENFERVYLIDDSSYRIAGSLKLAFKKVNPSGYFSHAIRELLAPAISGVTSLHCKVGETTFEIPGFESQAEWGEAP